MKTLRAIGIQPVAAFIATAVIFAALSLNAWFSRNGLALLGECINHFGEKFACTIDGHLLNFLFSMNGAFVLPLFAFVGIFAELLIPYFKDGIKELGCGYLLGRIVGIYFVAPLVLLFIVQLVLVSIGVYSFD